ncbi:uncharacterized protein LOC106156913 [Lingula anatina]|uniref:Uncharacterized protein LOC106156913 n=1 Tax=Lingula anatina TaxID=7574 RepID=A0A1S3HP35_LINAN|nr:uncharacterized protein LOC106156913 [Lingula anatina]|eukprot:XP_013387807.1 uncharacterized protein LOC106156913 [Lingula anatina]
MASEKVLRDQLKALRECVTKNRVALVTDLNVEGLLLTFLQQQSLLTEYQIDIIRAEKTRHDKAEKVLDFIITKGPDFLDKFITALRETSQDHLADLLETSKNSAPQIPVSIPGVKKETPYTHPMTAPDTKAGHFYNASTISVHHHYGSGDSGRETIYQREQAINPMQMASPPGAVKRKPVGLVGSPAVKLPQRDLREEMETERIGQTFQILAEGPRIKDLREKLLLSIKAHGMSFHGETPMDGNCFFHAVADQYVRLGLQQGITHREIRKLVVSYLQHYQQEYTLHINGSDWPAYVSKMAQDGAWADDLTIDATAKALGRKLLIVSSSPGAKNGVLQTIFNGNADGEPLMLGRYHENYYQSLEMANETDLKRLQTDLKSTSFSGPMEMETTDSSGTDFISQITGVLEEEKAGNRQTSSVSAPDIQSKPKPKFNQAINAYEFSEKDLDLVTNRFSEEIASEEKCGFGVVHRGVLNLEQIHGLEVAVKRLADNNDYQGTLEFDREKDWAKKKYVYLLTALGICDQLEGKYSKAVMTVYMKGGTLKDRLEESKISGKSLDWKTRLRMSVQLADAVKFLQSDDKTKCIVHKDIKSSNIFLDEHENIRLGDMGFAKMYSLKFKKTTITKTIPFAAGYTDPKLHEGLITETTDCYSIGIVLEELLTGVLASDPDPDKGSSVSLHLSWNNSGEEEEILIERGVQQGWPREISTEFARLIKKCKKGKPVKRIKVGNLYDALLKLYMCAVGEPVYGGTGGQPIQSEKCLYCLVHQAVNSRLNCGCKFLCTHCIDECTKDNKNIWCMLHMKEVKFETQNLHCDGNFTKLFDLSYPVVSLVKLINSKIDKHWKSVGLIKAIDVHGKKHGVATGFKIGGNYLMTNYHVAKDFRGYQGAIVEFGYLQETSRITTYKFTHMAWYSVALDAALFHIHNPDGHDVVPDLDCDIADVEPGKDVCIVGHNNCDPLRYDPDTKILSDFDVKKDIDLTLKTYPSASFTNAHDRNRQLMKSSFMHGASGSPCFDEYGNLALMYTKGYPENYKALRMAQTVFEQGVRMRCIYEELKKEKPELVSDLFPNVRIRLN